MNCRDDDQHDYENHEPIAEMSEYEEWYDDDLRRRNREKDS